MHAIQFVDSQDSNTGEPQAMLCREPNNVVFFRVGLYMRLRLIVWDAYQGHHRRWKRAW